MSGLKLETPIFDNGLCRCCGAMTKCRVLNEKYEHRGRMEVYSDMMLNCFGLELSHLDEEPTKRLICGLCVAKLRQALNFKIQVLQSEQAFLQSRMCNGGYKRSMEFVKTEMRNQSDDDEAVYVMSDGLDDELDAELLQEYYSLKGADSSPTNLHAWDNTGGPHADIDYRAESNDIDEYPTADNLLTMNMNTRKCKKAGTKRKTKIIINTQRKNPNSETGESSDPFKRAANVAHIVKYSYACPFRNRFNHILCYYCDEYFLNPALLREHAQQHPGKDFKPKFNKYTKLDLTRIDCKLCNESIEDLDEFKRHLVSSHGKHYFLDVKDSILPFKLVENVNKCTICGVDFSYFYALLNHVNQHFSNYMCENCGMGFTDEISLQKHVPSHDDKRYPCNTCGNTFKSDYNRLSHIRRIHQKKETGTFCTKCDAYLPLHERTKHMVEVHGESPTVPCQGCDQVFNSRRMLMLHVRREHMKDYRHQCHVCYRKFFQRSSLKHHMPTHTGERNFKCKVCEKTYPRLKTLKEHMRIHNNDRRYKCHICGQAFVQNCSLKGHMKSKHP